MYSEMGFLFSTGKKYNNEITSFSTEEEIELNEMDANNLDSKTGKTTYNYTLTSSNVMENYIKPLNTAYQADTKNPYIKLVEDFNSDNTKGDITPSKGLHLESDDFAYLRDIGVMPINRLMILRRYPDGAVVPKDLNGYNVKPISTIIGWVKEENEFFNFSVSEKWVTQGSDKMLHLLLNDIFSKEFGIKLDSIVPIPAWSVGFVFGFLNSMGVTNFDGVERIPAGNPFVLRESLTRDFENFGLSSTFNFKLETCYEQKYINGLDMTTATMDIMGKILTMGSSDMITIGRPGSQIIKQFQSANNNPSDVKQWLKLSEVIIDRFKSAMSKKLDELSTKIEEIYTDFVPADPKDDEKKTEEKKDEPKTKEGEEKKEADKNKLASANKSISLYSNFFKSTSKILQPILTSTIGKYQWPIRGSIAMLTGDAVTPWHLTIGNPYSPLLSMNNLLVEDVNVSGTGEMMYNDIPKYINVKIDIKQGRNMGKNEIAKMFNINYKRSYVKK